jgi:hypothetical protein
MPMPAPASLGSHPNSNIIGAMTQLAGCAAADTRSRTDADADASDGLAAGTLYHRLRLKHVVSGSVPWNRVSAARSAQKRCGRVTDARAL